MIAGGADARRQQSTTDHSPPPGIRKSAGEPTGALPNKTLPGESSSPSIRRICCPCGHLYDEDCSRHRIDEVLANADLDQYRWAHLGFDEINAIVRRNLLGRSA